MRKLSHPNAAADENAANEPAEIRLGRLQEAVARSRQNEAITVDPRSSLLSALKSSRFFPRMEQASCSHGWSERVAHFATVQNSAAAINPKTQNPALERV